MGVRFNAERETWDGESFSLNLTQNPLYLADSVGYGDTVRKLQQAMVVRVERAKAGESRVRETPQVTRAWIAQCGRCCIPVMQITKKT